jgi:hypothetical protein
MWVWALRGSRHFEPMSYSVWPQLPHRVELIIVSLDASVACGKARTLHRDAPRYLLRGPVLARMSPTTRERLFWIVHEIWGPAAQPPYIRMLLRARCAAGPSHPLRLILWDMVDLSRPSSLVYLADALVALPANHDVLALRDAKMAVAAHGACNGCMSLQAPS